MTKERRKPTRIKEPRPIATPNRRKSGTRTPADQQRATQLLAVAKTRDLTPEEMGILSVVQLSAYATIRQKRKMETR